MKKTLIALVIAVALSSCSKEEFVPAKTPTPRQPGHGYYVPVTLDTTHVIKP